MMYTIIHVDNYFSDRECTLEEPVLPLSSIKFHMHFGNGISIWVDPHRQTSSRLIEDTLENFK